MTLYQVIRSVPNDDPWHMLTLFSTLNAAHDLVRVWRRSDENKNIRYDIVAFECERDDLPWRVTKYWIGVTP
jgi:hypothetical protein